MKTIILFSLSFTFLLFTGMGLQKPPYPIQGTVSDSATGEALIGVNILIEGTKTGTVSGIDGRFTLNSPDSCVTLLVTYTGFEPLEMTGTCAGKPLLIGLTASTVLDEVVVTSPKLKRTKKNLTGAISRMEMKSVARPPASKPHADQPCEPEPGHNTEEYGLISENKFRSVGEHPLSTFSIDVDPASYSNIRRFITGGQLPPKDAVRIEEMINYFSYENPEPQDGRPFKVITELSECPWQPDHQLLRIGMQGMKIPTGQLPPSNFVFLLDVSGSMSDYNKLPLLKESLKMLVNNLRPSDKVSIVVYAGAAGVVLAPTGGSDKPKITEALEALEAGGSTAGGAGIQLAYQVAREQFVQNGNNRVILATDGDFNVGVSSESELVRLIEKEKESGIFLSVLGFGMGNYKDHKMQELADKGNGNHAYIDNLAEARKVLVNEFGGTLFTIAKDVKLQVEFNPAHVQGYRLIGYENRLLNREDFDDDAKDAGELGAGHQVTALYEIIPTGVKTQWLGIIPGLKYQESYTRTKGASGELGTVKLRYKDPDKNKSELIEQPVLAGTLPPHLISQDQRWAAAVAEFGMLLRNSEFKGNATYEHNLELAQNALGRDPHGYRSEMVRLLETARNLTGPASAGK